MKSLITNAEVFKPRTKSFSLSGSAQGYTLKCTDAPKGRGAVDPSGSVTPGSAVWDTVVTVPANTRLNYTADVLGLFYKMEGNSSEITMTDDLD